MRKHLISCCAFWLAMNPSSSRAASSEIPEATRNEIAHLLNRLETSGCRFQRNGAWHSGPEARTHLQRKYDYLADKGLVKSTEDFIGHGASESSMSGRPYQVSCPGQESENSARWLQEALRQLRTKQELERKDGLAP